MLVYGFKGTPMRNFAAITSTECTLRLMADANQGLCGQLRMLNNDDIRTKYTNLKISDTHSYFTAKDYGIHQINHGKEIQFNWDIDESVILKHPTTSWPFIFSKAYSTLQYEGSNFNIYEIGRGA